MRKITKMFSHGDVNDQSKAEVNTLQYKYTQMAISSGQKMGFSKLKFFLYCKGIVINLHKQIIIWGAQ